MAKGTSTEKAAARSASRPAAHRGDASLGGVAPAGHSVALDAARYRALERATRLEMDEEGAVRLVTALPPLPTWLDAEIRRHLAHLARDPLAVAALDGALVRHAVTHLLAVTR